MPYIKSDRREHFSRLTEFTEKSFTHLADLSAGDLNYLITKMILAYVKKKGVCYQTFNDVIGALEGAKLEAYRRQVGPYEDEKILSNGDVK